MITAKTKIDTRGLDGWKEKVQKGGPAVVKRGAFRLSGRAALNSPVDTGLLRNTLAAGSRQIAPLLWVAEDGTEYGIFQELGTSRGVPARHMLGSAAETEAQAFFDDVAELLKP